MTPPQTTPPWTQETLLPPEAVEIKLLVGLVGASGHAQWQLEVRNATDGSLLAMRSCPAVKTGKGVMWLDPVVQRLREATAEYLLPF